MISITIAALAGLTLAAAPAPCVSSSQSVPAQTLAASTSPLERAQAFLQILAARRFEDAVTWFDETMRSKVSAARLVEVWDRLLAQSGPFTSATDGEVQQKDTLRIVRLTLAFERATMRATVAFDAQDRVTGLWFRNAVSP